MLQKLNPPFEFRRPDFLNAANNSVYLKICEWLVLHYNSPIYNYTTVYKEIRVSSFLHYILGHVVFWANPERDEPYRTSQTYKSGYDMQMELAEAWEPVVPDEGDPAGTEKKMERRDKKVEKFVLQLKDLVRKSITPWTLMKIEVGTDKQLFNAANVGTRI